MKNHDVRATRIHQLIIIVAILLITLPGKLTAQQNKTKNPSGRDAYEAARARDRNLRDREMNMQHIGDATKPPTKQEQMLALAQIKEDFERMQAVNNNLMRDMSKSQTLDYKRISEATEEINKRAKRLASNLAFPETEEDKIQQENNQGQVDRADLRASLLKLDDSIMSFATNPHFHSLNVVNTQNASKAHRDLQVIIDVSEIIRKNADRLSKSPQKR